LKTSNVSALYTGKGDASDLNNYRPIAITSCFIKFYKKYSTINQLTDIYNTISCNLDKGKDLRFVFYDISKASDRVWHIVVFYKLKNYGIKGILYKWFKAYLSDREQRVIFEGYRSNSKLVSAGVPQGSVLSPFLFWLFINDITHNVISDIKLFADDTTLYVIISE